jgi:PhnB protein
MSTPKISPYLTVDNARETLNFYKDCFGGETYIMTVAETPIAKQLPPESQNKVMHASLTSDHISIAMSEMSGPQGFVRGNTVSLMINCTSEAELNQMFAKLSPGGHVMMPPGKQFWGSIFASFTDKFGIQWLLNYPLSA